MTTYRAVEISRYGGPNVLRITERPMPVPGPEEVLITVRAIGLNFADVACRLGLYAQAPPPPFVPGFEVAGDVAAIGPGVAGLQVGQRVVAAVPFGGYAEALIVPENRVFPLPEGLSYEEGAAFPVVYLTAYHALYHLGRLQDGMTVLIHAAAGGVGLAAIELARLKQVTLFGTAGSAEKIGLIRERGVDHPINYREQDFEEVVRERTRGRGVDLILDSVGGQTTRKNDRLLAKAGHLVIFGAASLVPQGNRPNWIKLGWQYLRMIRWNPLDLIPANKTISGFHLLLLWDEAHILGPSFAQLMHWLGEGKLHPTVGKVFPLDQAGEAQEYLHHRHSTGKVVLAVSR